MRKKHIAALAGIAAVFAVGGSLAYFNQDLEAVNVLKAGKFDTEIVEEFRPEEGKDWKPGTTVNKDFAVKNSGDVPMVVRVSFQETWEKDDRAYVTIDTTEKEEGHGEANNKFESVWQESCTWESPRFSNCYICCSADVDCSRRFRSTISRSSRRSVVIRSFSRGLALNSTIILLLLVEIRP